MHTHKHVSTPWLLLALSLGLVLFVLITVGSEIKQQSTSKESIVRDRFADIPAGERSTPLHTRFQELGPDTSCLNDLAIRSNSNSAAWSELRTFLEMHSYAQSSDIELQIRTLASEDETIAITSMCYFNNDLYAIRKLGEGEEFTGYDISSIRQGEHARIIEFIVPRDRIISMRTDVFAKNLISIAAREHNEDRELWYYFQFDPGARTFEQVEWCELWHGTALSPYGTEPNLFCEYIYAF